MPDIEFVMVTLPDGFVTAGTERPGLVTRHNPRVTKADIGQHPPDEELEPESVDVLVFHHAEDRTIWPIVEYFRVSLASVRAAGQERPADARRADSEPAAPVSGLGAGSGKGRAVGAKLSGLDADEG